jgi:Glycosyl hydrolase catalytic core
VSGTETTAPGAVSPWRGAGLVSLPQDCGDIATLGLSWYYNWWTDPQCPASGVPFVPMMWGDWCPTNTGCSTVPTHLASEGSPYLLTFNEPDNLDQSNMTVARALQLWPYLEATGLQLSSPAVTDTPQGTTWLSEFMAGAHAENLRVNFLAVHWYGNCADPADLVSYLGKMSAYGLPIWLTEFSCYQQSQAVNAQFAQEVMPELATLPYVQRVSWFTNRPYPNGYEFTGLLDASGALTPVGEAYISSPAGKSADGDLLPWPGS